MVNLNKRKESGKKKGHKPLPPALFFGGLGLLVAAGLGPAYYKYGSTFFLPESWKMLHLTEGEWMQQVLPNKTLVFVGGPHRGGTTLLWKLLQEHPEVGSFGDARQTGTDYSEGSFLQDVMPTFGVGQENLGPRASGLHPDQPQGLGTYALAARDKVSWTEGTKRGLVNAIALTAVLNKWGYYWQRSGAWDKRFWLEKTPTNAVTSRYLQALMDVGIKFEPAEWPLDGDAGAADRRWERPRETRSRFVFIVRHPLANALAHKPLLLDPPPLETLVENWVAVLTYMEEDRPHLRHSLRLKLEDLTSDRAGVMAKVWAFLGLPVPAAAANSLVVRPSPNEGYEKQYCEGLADPANLAAHRRLRERFGAKVAELGYGLDEWPCVAAAEAAG